MMFAYFKMGQVIALNVKSINSFCLPHLLEVSPCSITHFINNAQTLEPVQGNSARTILWHNLTLMFII